MLNTHSSAMHTFTPVLTLVLVDAAHAWVTTEYQYATCWTAETVRTTAPAPATTVTATLPLTTTVTLEGILVEEATATSVYVWGEGYQPYPGKRSETVIVSDVCEWWLTATATETAYTTNPKLTATVTSFEYTATTTSIYATESI
jgi:hypothetical protein